VINLQSGKEVWSRLTPDKLRKALTSTSLDIIEPLLPSEDEYALRLIDDRLEMGKIYAYLRFEELFKSSFRRELFSLFHKDELLYLSESLELDIWVPAEILSALVKLPWGDNLESRFISEFIGVPTWLLKIQGEATSVRPTQSIPWSNKFEALTQANKKEIASQLEGRGPFKRLKSYQSRIYTEAAAILENNNARILLNMPTGTGKTRTCMEIVCNFLNENPELSVVWLADKQELIDQACMEFHDTWEYLGTFPIPIQRWVRDSPHEVDKSQFICSTFGTLLSRGDLLKNIKVGLVVIDEAHMAIAPKWKSKVESTAIQMSNSTRVVGLTATPQRRISKESAELVDWFEKARLTIKDHGKGNLMDWLEANQFLSNAEIREVGSEASVVLTTKEKKALEEVDSDYSAAFLKNLASQVLFNSEITKELENLLTEKPDRRILYFGTTVEQSKMISVWLRMRGYSALHLDGSSDARVRQSGIDAFREGDLQVLCNYGILTTGFDAPLTDVVFIARPTTSPVLYHQMVGRGLRGPKLRGTSKCVIVDVEFNVENHASRSRQVYKGYRELWSEDEDDLAL
jgi:DNA repair protein RadD